MSSPPMGNASRSSTPRSGTGCSARCSRLIRSLHRSPSGKACEPSIGPSPTTSHTPTGPPKTRLNCQTPSDQGSLEAGIKLAGLRAAEHTAQVRGVDREQREKEFRTATLPLLFCSPTMELGVDIASLNAVAL